MATMNDLTGVMKRLNPINKIKDFGNKIVKEGVSKMIPGETLAQRNARLRTQFINDMKKSNPSVNIAPQNLDKARIAPVVDNTKITNPATVAPPAVPKISNDLGFSNDNIHADPLANTVSAATDTINSSADAAAAAEMAGALAQQQAMAGNQSQEAADIEAQKLALAELMKQGGVDYQKNVDMANASADEAKRALGNAGNIAAARTGKSRLLNNDQLIQDIVNQGSSQTLAANVARNAEISKAGTTLAALKESGYFKTAELIKIGKAMREKGVQPVLDAIKASTVGKTGAVGKIGALIGGIQTGLIEDQVMRAKPVEGQMADENEFANAPADKKTGIVLRWAKELAPYASQIEKLVQQHPDWTRTRISAEIANTMMGKEEAAAGYLAYLQGGGKGSTFWDTYGEKLGNRGNESYAESTQSATQVADTQAKLKAEGDKARNPLTLTSTENLDFFKSLGQGSEKQKRFIADFKKATAGLTPAQLKVQRGPIFIELRKQYSNAI